VKQREQVFVLLLLSREAKKAMLLLLSRKAIRAYVANRF